MAEDNGDSFFEHCVFALLPSKDLTGEYMRQLAESILGSKGEVKVAGPDRVVDFDRLTHIISSSIDFPQYSAARDQMVAVVTPAWVSNSLLRGKQAPIRPFTPDPALFFSQLAVTCADIPRGDKDAIIGAVLAMGGLESSSLTKTTTHICALTMDHPKCQQAKEKNLKVKIVLPHWFDDCLRLGKRIDEGPYELPDPEIFRKNPEDAVPIPATLHIQGATSPHPETFPLPTESPDSRHLDVFENKTVMISEDLGIGSRLRKIIEDLIKDGGGEITNSVHNADIYVCHWRAGRDYVFASRAGIDVGNLSWLYHLITHNEWTSPLKRLLHYPLPENGVPGFKEMRITLSNYGGEARIYLENLVVAAGAEFTKSMKQDNTHLITARNSSEKCNAAAEWNIEMVNHLWIEESYANCSAQSLTIPRYTHFPPRTNLGEIIGQTEFDKDILESMYFPIDPTPSPSDPKPRRRPVMLEKDRNMPSLRRSNDHKTKGGQHNGDLKEVEEGVRNSKSAPLPRPRSRASTGHQLSTPARDRRISAGKENDTPSSTGSRSAKDKALSKIQGLASDIALYEKEKKRKSHVWGGERAANMIEKEISLERSSSPAGKNDENEYSDDEGRTPKRVKTGSGLPPVEMRLLITGYKGWIANPTKEDLDKKKLRELGILVVQDPNNCTHLAAPKMVRTQKFLCALATGPTIVSSDFIDACIRQGEVPEVKDFLLKDRDNEKKFKLKLPDVISRAKANKRSLLRRVPIYSTAEIPNGPETYKSIVESNGGIFSIYRARGGSTIKPTSPEDDDEPEPVYLITGSRPEERKLWPKFVEMAKAGNMIPRVVNHEWLLDVAMSQQLKWNERYLVE